MVHSKPGKNSRPPAGRIHVIQAKGIVSKGEIVLGKVLSGWIGVSVFPVELILEREVVVIHIALGDAKLKSCRKKVVSVLIQGFVVGGGDSNLVSVEIYGRAAVAVENDSGSQSVLFVFFHGIDAKPEVYRTAKGGVRLVEVAPALVAVYGGQAVSTIERAAQSGVQGKG